VGWLPTPRTAYSSDGLVSVGSVTEKEVLEFYRLAEIKVIMFSRSMLIENEANSHGYWWSWIETFSSMLAKNKRLSRFSFLQF